MPSPIRFTNCEVPCFDNTMMLRWEIKCVLLLQWRANASQYLGQATYGMGKENWGWSWMERWIAARPWEVRVNSLPIRPKKPHSKQASKSEKEMNGMKLALPNGKTAPKVKKVTPNDG